MNYISDTLIEEFLSTLERKYNREEFYLALIKFIDKNKIYIENGRKEDELEQKIFNIAKKRGLIGYDIIQEISDMDFFLSKMNILVEKNRFNLYHFAYELDVDISIGAFYEKWNQVPPSGWIGSWCKCGEFYPCTFDMNEMDLIEHKYEKLFENQQPRRFSIDEIETVLICSDSYFRLKLKSGDIVAVRPYKFDKGFKFNFIDNPLDILK
jgi:hypothetical protein